MQNYNKGGVAWIIVALVVGGIAGYFLGTSNAPAGPSALTGKGEISQEKEALSKAMRKLWEDHIIYTRLYIVEAVAGHPGASQTATRLLKNQDDIGQAISAYYGAAAGTQLTTLLKTHIQGAVDILSAAKAGDQAKLATAKTAWYNNANEIAAFLNQANPTNWELDHLQTHMRDHLDLTLSEAVSQLGGKYAESIANYDQVHEQMLHFADALTDGIVAQFPDKF